jgi:hypothetical protein
MDGENKFVAAAAGAGVTAVEAGAAKAGVVDAGADAAGGESAARAELAGKLKEVTNTTDRLNCRCFINSSENTGVKDVSTQKPASILLPLTYSFCLHQRIAAIYFALRSWQAQRRCGANSGS